jgi:hypothetical protein
LSDQAVRPPAAFTTSKIVFTWMKLCGKTAWQPEASRASGMFFGSMPPLKSRVTSKSTDSS